MKRSLIAALTAVAACGGLLATAPLASASTVSTAVIDCSTVANGAQVYAPTLAAADDLKVNYDKCQGFTFTRAVSFSGGGPITDGSNGPGNVTFTNYSSGSTLATVSDGTKSFTIKVAIHALADKVTICHRTHSLTNPYVFITVAASSIINNAGTSVGHGKHNSDTRHPSSPSGIFDPSYSYPSNAKFWGDIIPPFIDNATGQVFAGLNWAYGDPVSVTGPGSSGLWIKDTQFTNAVTLADRTDPTKGISYCLDNARNTLTQKQLFNLEVKNGQDPTEVVDEFTDTYDRTGATDTVTPAQNLSQVQTVTTDPATGLTTTQATLNGTLKSGSTWTGWYFQWTGSDPYGSLTSTSTTSFGATAGPLSEAFTLTGLTCGTTYNYRIVGLDNSAPAVSYYGAFVSFTTAACPSGGGGTPAPTPAPATIAAVNDAYTTPYNTPLTIAAPGVLGNDSGSGLRVASYGQPSHGTVTMNPDGSFSYFPTPGFSGVDTFTYDIVDSSGRTASATVTITVPGPPAGTPVSRDDAFTGPFNTPILGSVQGNDTFPTGSRYSLRTPPAHGTVTVNPDGTFTYTPNPGFSGQDTFTYTVCLAPPNAGVCSASTVTLTIAPPASTPGPITDPDIITLPAGSAGPVAFAPISLGTPSKGATFNGVVQIVPPGGTSWGSTVTIPGQGVWQVSGTQAAFTPFPGFVGTSSLPYRIQDTTGRWATSTLTVIRPAIAGATPQAPPYQGVVPVGTVKPVPFVPILGATPAAGSPLRPDTLAIAPASDPGWTDRVTVPGKGTFRVEGDRVVFSPTPGFTDSVQIRYRLLDVSGRSAWNTITVTTPPPPGMAPVLLPTSKLVPAGSDKPVSIPTPRMGRAAIGSVFDPTSVAVAPLNRDWWSTAMRVPGKGQVTVRNGRVRFLPSRNFAGRVVVKVRISQRNGQFATSTMTFTGRRAGRLHAALAGR